MLDQGLYDGAYCLGGYAVECALKACIAKNVRRHDFPDKKAVLDSYTHDLSKLIRAADLYKELERGRKDQQFEINWAIVEKWSEESRYKLNTKVAASDLYTAVTARKHGVIPWIKQYW